MKEQGDTGRTYNEPRLLSDPKRAEATTGEKEKIEQSMNVGRTNARRPARRDLGSSRPRPAVGLQLTDDRTTRYSIDHEKTMTDSSAALALVVASMVGASADRLIRGRTSSSFLPMTSVIRTSDASAVRSPRRISTRLRRAECGSRSSTILRVVVRRVPRCSPAFIRIRRASAT